jgi:phosphohistidine phosphatase
MKKLHFIRHAKSSWKDSSLHDIDRPLNNHGLKSCPIMATQIEKSGCNFDHVFCSTAVRTH